MRGNSIVKLPSLSHVAWMNNPSAEPARENRICNAEPPEGSIVVMKRLLLFTSVLSLISGCATQKLQPIDIASVSTVQAKIKEQVGVYMQAARYLSLADGNYGAVVVLKGK